MLRDNIKMTQKTTLILEGGAMRGLYSAGVIDVLMKNKIDFDVVYGVSAGALIPNPQSPIPILINNNIFLKIKKFIL